MTLPVILLASSAFSSNSGAIELSVDATTAPKDVIWVHEVAPVSPGTVTFVYPKWIPGHHSPSGPITQLIDLHFSGNGKELTWRRDDVDMFAFHIQVPSGVSKLEIDMANVAPTGAGTSPKIAWISFNELLLYPAKQRSDDVSFHAKLKLPQGWSFATAQHDRGSLDGWIDFLPLPLTRLVDSPVLSGQYVKRQMLDTGPGPTHEIDMAGDDAKCIEMPPDLVTQYANLAKEARALFGATHYNEYHWLVPVSDTIRGRGLEHNECSEDGASRSVFAGDRGKEGLAGLLAHEYTHSWCGKYRRPIGLATPNYQEPMKGELLYVYEGMTQYWGTVLPARAGLWTKDQFINDLARSAASMDHQSGETWRNIQDTAIASQISRGIRDGWSAEHRGQDYYVGGLLIWLDADATIRAMSHGTKSLDDFCKGFFGPPSTGPIIKPYNFDDLVNGLNKVQANDWRTFLRTRLDAHVAPLGGIEASGWKLVYSDVQARPGPPDFRYSLGISVAADGAVSEIISRMPGDVAGIVPGQKILQVEGKPFTMAGLEAAVKQRQPFDITVKSGDDSVPLHIAYADGAKYATLQRDSSKPDYLSQIIEGKAKL